MIEALAVLIALVGTGFSMFWAGIAKGRADRDADDAMEYRETRGKLDNADLGLGASDSERIDRLRDLANGR